MFAFRAFPSSLKYVNWGIFLTFVVAVLPGCQPVGNAIIPTNSTVDVLVSTVLSPYLTETPLPACVSLPDVELTVEMLSDDSVKFKITGLKPNEPVYTLFSSELKNKGARSTGWGEKADENGAYESKVRLRGPMDDLDFKDWQMKVIHSRGSTCADFSLP